MDMKIARRQDIFLIVHYMKMKSRKTLLVLECLMGCLQYLTQQMACPNGSRKFSKFKAYMGSPLSDVVGRMVMERLNSFSLPRKRMLKTRRLYVKK
jgi:hypothetical protein